MVADTNNEVAKHMKQRKYDSTTLDTPFFHIVLEPLLPSLRPVMNSIFAIRWKLSRPLQTRLFPHFCPLIDIPGVRDLPFLTVGQVLLALPLVGILIGGVMKTFVSPDVKDSGRFASYAIYYTLLSANKTNSVFAFLFGIPFERMIPFHNVASLFTLTLALMHAYVAYAHGEEEEREQYHQYAELSQEITVDSEDRRLSEDEYALYGDNPDLGKFMFDGVRNTSGSLLAITVMVLISTSFFPIFRRKFFDIWLWIHILAALCIIIFATMHDVKLILLFAAWWGVDLLTRYLVMATCRYPRKAQLHLITNDVVKVSFEKPSNFSYNAGQFVQIAFPDIGFLEFHPITISSAPHEDVVTIHIKGSGGWSNKVIELAKDKKEVRVLIEGPYGSLSVDIEADWYQMALLVCGGIGVTPCGSVAKSLIHRIETGEGKLKQLQFVWAVRDLDLPTAMGPLSTVSDLEVANNSSDDTRAEDIEVLEQPVQTSSIVKTNIFVTKASQDTPAILSHGRKISKGRPDLYGIVADMKEYALEHNVTHVAVFGCGPQALINDMKLACRKHTQGITESQGVTFDVHEEIFHF